MGFVSTVVKQLFAFVEPWCETEVENCLDMFDRRQTKNLSRNCREFQRVSHVCCGEREFIIISICNDAGKRGSNMWFVFVLGT